MVDAYAAAPPEEAHASDNCTSSMAGKRWVVRERHSPRLCPSCGASLARQENACWRCGALWIIRAQAGGPRHPGFLPGPLPTRQSR
jgi:predicted RNA-binding Zn-ribbon protein involved in translation (DUF1610 family)